MLKKISTCVSMLLACTQAFNVNVSGKLDLSKAGTFKTITAVIPGTDLVDTVNQDGTYQLKTQGVGIAKHTQYNKPVLAWNELGKSVRLVGNVNGSGYVVDAYTFDGKLVKQGATFLNGIAVVGDGTRPLYTRIRNTNNASSNFAGRSVSDSLAKGSVVFIITTCDIDSAKVCRTDTLTEIPVTKWDTVLNTKYVVQRNVKVTVPNKYAADSVKVGYYNVYVNPQNYFTIPLSNYKSRKWSGYIYSAYDSASYGADSYLYSAVVICKKKDSVLAFSDSVARVTARTGDIEFDSTELVNKIVSKPLADTAIVPWYAFTVNKSAVNVALNRVMTLDTSVSYSDTLVDSAYARAHSVTQFGFIGTARFDSLGHASEMVSGYHLFSSFNIAEYRKAYDDSTVISTLDSIKVTFVADTTDTAGYVSIDTLNTREKQGLNIPAFSKKFPVVAGTTYTFSFPVTKNMSYMVQADGYRVQSWDFFIHFPRKEVNNALQINVYLNYANAKVTYK